MTTASDDFETFFREAEPRLRRAYGGRIAPPHVGDAVSTALEFAWTNWDRVAAMEFPLAYLFRVGLSKSRRRKEGRLPASPPHETDHVEPGLVSAMQRLPRRQREVVWLVEACDWTPTEAADALDLSLSAVRTHRSRGLHRVVAQMLTSPAHTHLIAQALGTSFEKVDVGGVDAWLNSTDDPRSIVWSPDGTSIVVLGVADGRIDPLAVAQSVSEFDTETFESATTTETPVGVGDGCDGSIFC